MSLRERMSKVDENMMFLTEPDWDEALMGVAEGWDSSGKRLFRAVYDLDKCVEVLEKRGMDYEEATEYLDFNVLGAYVGPHSPLFFTKPDDEEE